MQTRLVREWKKVFESDIGYISYELKEIVRPKAVIFLEGPLGSGKTTFAKDFLGSDEQTMSPSYSVVYETSRDLHADFYRIEETQDVFQLEIPLYLEEKNYFLVEWGRKFFKTLTREIPEEFDMYLLELDVNNSSQSESEDKSIFSRNFKLSEIEEY